MRSGSAMRCSDFVISKKKGAGWRPFTIRISLTLGFLCLGLWLLLFEAILVFAHKGAELWIVILLAVKRVV